MTLRRLLIPTRTYAVWGLLSAVGGLAICFVPLFNLVGYESAAFFGAIFGPLAAFLTLHAFRVGLLREPLESERERLPFDDFARLAARHLALLAPPLIFLSANAVRVRNCDFQTGFLFWLLIPVGSILIGQTLGWAVAAIVPKRRWLRNLTVVVALLASVVTFGLHLALQPPITGHQLFLGFFSGSIYDEALALPSSLVAYRATNLAVAGLVLVVLETVRRYRSGEVIRWLVGIGSALGIVSLALWLNWQSLGIGLDRSYIQESLGGRLETEHFVIHYPERKSFLDQLERLAEDHEFRYSELQRYFRTDPASDEKIHSYVYPNREVKGELMGGRRTLVAKIWLGEIHVLWPRYGHHWLAHELAHLFTAPFGATPLKLSVQNGIGVNMGLVEGIATAADWPVDDLTPHQASAALRRLEMAPSIRRIVGASGFWTQSSGRAYTLVGSFIRYLVDEYGIEKFKRAYGHGEFEAAYGKDVGVLVSEWEAFLDELELSEASMEVARYLYRRPSIFGKVCARTTAELRRRARIAAARGDVGEMRRLYEKLLGFAPRNHDYRIEFARRLVRAGDPAASLEIVDRLLEQELPPVQTARLLQLRGDIYWHRDRPSEAGAAYTRCLEEGLPVDFRRLVRAKHVSVEEREEPIRSLAFSYFLGQKPGAVSLFFPMEWHRRKPDDPLAKYLVGRRLWQNRAWAPAEELLENTPETLKGAALSAEAFKMRGRSQYFQDDYGAAARTFERLRGSPLPRYRSEAEEWLRRISWRRARGERASTE